MTKDELKLFSEFLRQKENSASDGILTPTTLQELPSPAILQGPAKSTVGRAIEKTLPRLIMKAASETSPSDKGREFLKLKKRKLENISKGSFKGIGH